MCDFQAGTKTGAEMANKRNGIGRKMVGRKMKEQKWQKDDWQKNGLERGTAADAYER